ncbi:DUF2752 domain-containing protein [Siphonobacter sp. SORGH_AS_0500]|uniref:DUF2752 domain-containing protein n=1 Tax=Siphonobacter sp. SORGH_AS_0500 TaxID=1864824 RepID=UPI00286465DE|nr:DUF2752 domain-containing protein [Siphonobacter sp. SORGH_AS_0500]MDR6194479.1 phosphoglycerol transferase MdoB-like AlkP superfamily enzyme [Siphonobacter sp. SORGH_AS_0500]
MVSTLRLFIYWIMAAILVAVIFLYYEFNPVEHAFFPPCLFYKYTGLHCPGCGAQRALHQLLHGNFREAFRFNALLLLMIPYLSLGFVLSIRTHLLGLGFETLPQAYRNPKVISGLLTLVCLFWILRNIPMAPFNWLAPQ